MLQVNDRVAIFEGTKMELMFELTVIIKSMIEKGVINKSELDMIIKTAFMSNEELHDKCVDEMIDELLKQSAEIKSKLNELDEEAKKHPEDKEKLDTMSKLIRDIIDEAEGRLNDSKRHA